MKNICEELERYLRLRTKPVAARMIRRENEIPDGATRPLKDLGSHISLCQAFSQARRHGVIIAMLKEDNWLIFDSSRLLGRKYDFDLEQDRDAWYAERTAVWMPVPGFALPRPG